MLIVDKKDIEVYVPPQFQQRDNTKLGQEAVLPSYPQHPYPYAINSHNQPTQSMPHYVPSSYPPYPTPYEYPSPQPVYYAPTTPLQPNYAPMYTTYTSNPQSMTQAQPMGFQQYQQIPPPSQYPYYTSGAPYMGQTMNGDTAVLGNYPNSTIPPVTMTAQAPTPAAVITDTTPVTSLVPSSCATSSSPPPTTSNNNATPQTASSNGGNSNPWACIDNLTSFLTTISTHQTNAYTSLMKLKKAIAAIQKGFAMMSTCHKA